ncbi:MAG: hypothetical protein A2Y89_05445 [Chloroflexi bacterium RBG_13_51_18]|nr:MAG: hypothetical protein A2Y89_05445 [Chloroflexi bacterium RBG_13_51_18]
MVEIRYSDQYEITDLAGQTVCEARQQFKSDFGIPEKASARLNGSKVKANAELDTVLNDDDKLTFAVSRSRTPFLIGALLLALAVTGSVFAFGWINASTTITSTVGNNFANVIAANNLTGWTAHGNTKGNIGTGNIFTIMPDPTYTGDLVITVSIGNAAELAQQYRVLSLQLELVQSDNVTTIDLSAGNSGFWTMLTLQNGSVDLFPLTTQNMSVRVKSGFYITQAKGTGPWGGASSPDLFCEVTQR